MFTIFVKAPEGNGYTNGQAMQRINDHIQQHKAGFNNGFGIPTPESDGSWKVLVYSDNQLDKTVVKGILAQHYGLVVLSE